MPKITELYCFAINDKGPDDEGVPAFRSFIGGVSAVMPMMGADIEKVVMLMPRAQEVANETGQPLRIYRFSHMEQIGEVSPQIGMPASEPGRCPECRALLGTELTNHAKGCSVGAKIAAILRAYHPVAADPPVTHGLRGGFALCGFANAVPAKWPSGHFWADPQTEAATITCQDCLEVLRRQSAVDSGTKKGKRE